MEPRRVIGNHGNFPVRFDFRVIRVFRGQFSETSPHVEIHDDRITEAQAVARDWVGFLVEDNLHGNALHDLVEVAGRILGRHECDGNTSGICLG